jgi:hypothetical protein
MSRILRRPMFRGGRVNSYGTGIASGLANGGRVGFFNGGTSGGEFLKKARMRGPRDFGITSVNPFFNPKINIGTPRKPKFVDRPLYEEFPEVDKFPLYADAENIVTDATITDTPDKEVEEIRETASVEEGLPISVLPKEKEEKTPKVNEPDEAEVTMTDLEKALGLDDAKREYASDALAAASKAFFEGRGFEAISDAAQVKSKAPEIKRLAGLEEFKAKKAKELFDAKERQKRFAPGNVQKTVDYLTAKGISEDEAIKIATKQSPTFAAELSKHTTGNVILPDGFKLAAEIFYGSEYKGNQLTDGDMIIGEKVELENGVYTDKDNKLLFEVEDKKVVRKNSYK